MAIITGIRTHIFIGGLEIIRTPRVYIESERHMPLSIAGITLPDPKGEYCRAITAGDAVEIRLGYRDEEPAVWKGTVSGTRPGTKDQVVIDAIGEELPLSVTHVNQSWENEAPEAIVSWAAREANLEAGRIDSPGVVFPRFVACTIPVWQVAVQCSHTCRKAFDLDMSGWALWVGADGKVNWGDFDEPGDVPEIATGAGLIKHSPDRGYGSLNLVETFLIPGLRHSHKFRLTDTRRGIDGEFRALSVRHEIRDRSVRTFIRYGDEYEKF